jgi:hypothetical protein
MRHPWRNSSSRELGLGHVHTPAVGLQDGAHPPPPLVTLVAAPVYAPCSPAALVSWAPSASAGFPAMSHCPFKTSPMTFLWAPSVPKLGKWCGSLVWSVHISSAGSHSPAMDEGLLSLPLATLPVPLLTPLDDPHHCGILSASIPTWDQGQVLGPNSKQPRD